jgi:hypothetical protein
VFALRASVERDRFRSALAIGTRLGLAGAVDRLRRFLDDLAHVTTPGAAAVVDCYDPDHPGADDLLGTRSDSTPGLGHRVVQFECEGDPGAPLLFRLFAPERLREAAGPTPWTVREVRRRARTPAPTGRSSRPD